MIKSSIFLTSLFALMVFALDVQAQSFADGVNGNTAPVYQNLPFTGNSLIRSVNGVPTRQATRAPAKAAPVVAATGQRTGLPDTENGEGGDANYSNEGRNYSATSAAGAPEDTSNYSNEGRNSPAPEDTSNYSNEGRNHSQPSGEAASSCEDEAKTAKLACLFPGIAGMDDGNSMVYTMMMNQLVSTAAQIAAIGKNMSAQCKLQADVSKVMGTINSVKGATCMKMISSCSDACHREYEVHHMREAEWKSSTAPNSEAMALQEREEASKARTAESQCKAYSGQVTAMMMGAMQNLGNFAVNKQCEHDMAAYAAAAPPAATLPPIAAVGDCSDPNNQSLACFCTKAGNATTAMCAGFNNGSLAGGTTTTPNGSSVTSPVGASIPVATDGNTVDPFAPAKKDQAGDGKGPGDGGSGAPGGGGISALSSEGGGSGAGGDPRSAITGTSGGTGSGLGSAGGGGGGAGGLARNNGGNAKDGFFDKFNLKKFLPGSKYKTRGIAGMSVKSVDGITGPMGPTIWEKATRQYQEQIQKQNVLLEK